MKLDHKDHKDHDEHGFLNHFWIFCENVGSRNRVVATCQAGRRAARLAVNPCNDHQLALIPHGRCHEKGMISILS